MIISLNPKFHWYVAGVVVVYNIIDDSFISSFAPTALAITYRRCHHDRFRELYQQRVVYDHSSPSKTRSNRDHSIDLLGPQEKCNPTRRKVTLIIMISPSSESPPHHPSTIPTKFARSSTPERQIPPMLCLTELQFLPSIFSNLPTTSTPFPFSPYTHFLSPCPASPHVP